MFTLLNSEAEGLGSCLLISALAYSLGCSKYLLITRCDYFLKKLGSCRHSLFNIKEVQLSSRTCEDYLFAIAIDSEMHVGACGLIAGEYIFGNGMLD